VARRPASELAGVTTQPMRVGDVDVICCEADSASRTVVYLHGGGFRLGTAQAWTGLGNRIAQSCRARVLLVDYRLAPEYPFPAGLHDVLAVLEHAAREGDPFVVAGDSAGGGLAAASVAACVQAGSVVPAGLVCISGWFDLTVTASTYRSKADSDVYFSRPAAEEASGAYLQGWDARDPVASPLFADVAGFPPTLLCASSSEVLLDDTLAFTARLAEADVAVRTVIRPGLPHAWTAVDAQSDATTSTLADIETFMVGLD
jgi:acetyl esterase/lipase